MAETVRRRQERQRRLWRMGCIKKMYVTKLCVRMSYVKKCKKIVCERVVREKWCVKHDKIVCGTGVGPSCM